MSGKSIMNKFVITNIVKYMVNCSYICLFYLILCCNVAQIGVMADKEPQPQYDSSDVTDRIERQNLVSSSSDTKSSGIVSDVGFIHAFLASFSVIIVSELGDKTFFIAAIMAMRHPRLVVFIGAIAALALMTVLSVVFGMAANIIPHVYTYYISTALFAFFGLKMLYDGYYMTAADTAEEFEEVQSDLRKREDELRMKTMNENRNEIQELVSSNEDELNNKNNKCPEHKMNGSLHELPQPHQQSVQNSHISASAVQLSSSDSTNSLSSLPPQRQRPRSVNVAASNNGMSKTSSNSANSLKLNNNRFDKEVNTGLMQDAETGVTRKAKSQKSAVNFLTRIFMQAFTMTFLAEWGDRSQLTTIILGARENAYGVIVGGIIGHSICTGLAVIGGRMIAQKISVRTVTLIGGVVFLLFAVSALFFNPNEEAVQETP